MFARLVIAAVALVALGAAVYAACPFCP